MLVLVSLLYLLLRNGALAAPTRSTSTWPLDPHPITDVPDSGDYACACLNMRSIWDIIWSCFSTIFACSWLAVHPNIPPENATWWKIAMTRLELMLWTIVAPEMMICWAIRQWIGARNLAYLYKDKQPRWTKTHGYFIQMGGFMLVEGNERTTLYPERLELLTNNRMIEFPTITEGEILDRSKGDALSKTLVLGQTTWFIGQCITRSIQGLPTTELELVTLAFAALNGFIYFFWWNKPLDVRTTVPVYLRSTPIPDGASQYSLDLSTEPNTTATYQVRDIVPTRRKGCVKSLAVYGTLVIFGLKQLLTGMYRWPCTFVLSLFQRLNEMSGLQISSCRSAMFYAYDDLSDAHIVRAVSSIGVVFGAVHCAGWHFFFPTETETSLWRTSSLVVTGIPFILAVVSCMAILQFGSRRLAIPGCLRQVAETLRVIGIVLGIPIYILARIILLVEALLTLRHLPTGSLLMVQWTSYLPHI